MPQIFLSWLFCWFNPRRYTSILKKPVCKNYSEDKAGELFGFYNTFGRAGSVLGPLLINIFLSYSNDLKVALIPLAIIFLIGLVLLYFVKER